MKEAYYLQIYNKKQQNDYREDQHFRQFLRVNRVLFCVPHLFHSWANHHLFWKIKKKITSKQFNVGRVYFGLYFQRFHPCFAGSRTETSCQEGMTEENCANMDNVKQKFGKRQRFKKIGRGLDSDRHLVTYLFQ